DLTLAVAQLSQHLARVFSDGGGAWTGRGVGAGEARGAGRGAVSPAVAVVDVDESAGGGDLRIRRHVGGGLEPRPDEVGLVEPPRDLVERQLSEGGLQFRGQL